MQTVILFILTNIVAQALKGVVAPKYGALGVQVTVGVLATIGAIVWYVALGNAAVMSALVEAVKIAAYAITFYEVILKNINIKGYTIVTTKDLKR